MIQHFFRETIILILGFIAAVYLINPTFGVLEFIPDNLPLIGNLDEAGATVLLVSVLGHYGIDLAKILPQKRKTIVRRVPKRRVNSTRSTIDSLPDETLEAPEE